MHNSECYFDYNLGPAIRLSARYSSARFALHKELLMPWRFTSHAHIPPTQKASTVSSRGPSSVETLMRFTPPAYCRSSILASFLQSLCIGIACCLSDGFLNKALKPHIHSSNIAKLALLALSVKLSGLRIYLQYQYFGRSPPLLFLHR